MSELHPQYVLNKYTCPDCKYSWPDIWECEVNDVCPACGTRHIEPWWSEEIDLNPNSTEHQV